MEPLTIGIIFLVLILIFVTTLIFLKFGLQQSSFDQVFFCYMKHIRNIIQIHWLWFMPHLCFKSIGRFKRVIRIF